MFHTLRQAATQLFFAETAHQPRLVAAYWSQPGMYNNACFRSLLYTCNIDCSMCVADDHLRIWSNLCPGQSNSHHCCREPMSLFCTLCLAHRQPACENQLHQMWLVTAAGALSTQFAWPSLRSVLQLPPQQWWLLIQQLLLSLSERPLPTASTIQAM